MLAKRFKLAEEKKQIQGIRIAPTSPRISHLLFADDSLFFCQAKRDEIEMVTQMLKDYSEASGQKINLDKSSIVFGHKVTDERAAEIRETMGINNVGGKGVYLGLPEVFIGSKVSTLRFLEERMSSKINSWKSKFLSLSGKEMLIKAVVLALPTYSMSCFLLPKELCKRLNAIMARFWWKSQHNDCGIHWAEWKKLCTDKAKGGMGFRDIEGFNLALLGKQIWRVATQPNSLLARTLKGRYFKDKDILSASVGTRPFCAWRSIHKAQVLLKLGMQKIFGNGKGIKLLEDPWVVEKHPRPPVLNHGFDRESAIKEYFLEPGSDEWKIERLKDAFPEKEWRLICRIKPSKREVSVPYRWIHLTDGVYTVKSGYRQWVEMERRKMMMNQEEVLNPNIDKLLEEVWKIKTIPKVRHLLWRILCNHLPTNSKIRTRKLTKQAECPRCGSEEEDRDHIFFTCPYARAVWASSSA